MAQSKITSKYQTTVPKEIRTKLGIRPGDVVRWDLVDGGVRVEPARHRFLERVGTIQVGPGSAVDDVRRARRQRGKDFR